MANIFVSYARQDKTRVAPLVAALKAHGWSVWWDPAIVPGEEFDSLIRQEISAASAVIVVWTPASIASRWVRGEARLGAERGILVPVRFERAELPIDAMAIHTTDLDDWKEDAKSGAFQELLGALSRHLKDIPRAAAEAERGTSICVLPFANMSDDPQQDYFSDGISEDIITDLSKVSALAVISRNSAFTFKGKHVDLPEVARQLKVTHVLEGSVRKSGNRVRITAQLIDGATNNHLWAERWDRTLDDIFALQDEISQAIVTALKLKLLPGEKQAIEDRGDVSPETYDKYLRARSLTNAVSDLANAELGANMLREILAANPKFTKANGTLSNVYVLLGAFAAGRSEQVDKEVEISAAQALVHAPDAWGTHLLNGFQLARKRQWLLADDAFEKLRVNAPRTESDATIIYALFLGTTGRIEDAVRELEQARSVDPLSVYMSVVMQQALDCAGHSAEAEAEYERGKGVFGYSHVAEHTRLLRLAETGDKAAIKAQCNRFLETSILPVAGEREALEAIDQPERARELLRQAARDPANQDESRMTILTLHAGLLGDDELAMELLPRALSGLSLTPWHPRLRKARRTPAFKEFIRDLGLYDFWRQSGKCGDFARPLGSDDFEITR